MKVLIAISLSFLVFFQSVGMDMSDIFMLTDFIEHAKFHSVEHGDDFFTFLDKHYGSLKAAHEEAHQEEKSEHEKLPFQNKTNINIISEVIVEDYEFPLIKSMIYHLIKHHFYYQNHYNFLDRDSIFQPPRFA